MARSTLSLILLTSLLTAVFCHESSFPNTQGNIWLYALLSTCLISAAPFFILLFIPLDNGTENSPFLKILLSFASGGLLGDAFLHLIPHSVTSGDHEDHHDHHHHNHHDHDHHHHDHHHHDHHHHDHHSHSHNHMQDMVVGLWVLIGIVVFLIVEKFVRMIKGDHHHHNHGGGGGHSVESKQKDQEPLDKEGIRQRKKQDKKQEKETPSKISNKEIKVSGYLNLAADFAHNFTDGLAIGASYLAGYEVGLITTFTILIHEIPHEIGDFAILIQSGHSKHKAMLLQLVTAVGAIVGTVIGLLAEGVAMSSTNWILPFTAGGFIYIATVSVIPELLEDTSVWQSIKELLALMVGVGMMIAITYLE